MFASGKGAVAIVKEKGLEQVSDTGLHRGLWPIRPSRTSPGPVAEYKAGKAGLDQLHQGAGDEASKGQANPRWPARFSRRNFVLKATGP